jgi:hypothetical protein
MMKTVDTLQKLPRVRRVEVIDSDGRTYTEHNASSVEVSFQDDGTTLKVFLDNRQVKKD